MDPKEALAAIHYIKTGRYLAGMGSGEKRKMRRMKTAFIYREGNEKGDRLYFRGKDSKRSIDECQLVLLNDGIDPSTLSIIQIAHKNEQTHAHFTSEETFENVSKRWWWPRYMDEIRDYVRHCDQCTNHTKPGNSSTSSSELIEKSHETNESIVPRRTKKTQNLNIALPTMVLSTGITDCDQNNSPSLVDDRSNIDKDDGVFMSAMSSSNDSNDVEKEDRTLGGNVTSFVEKDEHGGVTIVIPSEPPPPPTDSYSPNKEPRGSTMNDISLPKSTLCGECGSVIRNANNVVVHMRRHLQYKPYHCQSCEYQGYDMDDVTRHAVRTHAFTSNNECGVDFKPNPEMETQLNEMIASNKTIGGRDEVNDTDAGVAGDSVTRDGSNGDGTEIDNDQQTAMMTNLALYAAAFASHRPSIAPWKHVTSSSISDENMRILSCNICNSSVPNNPVPLLRHLRTHFDMRGYSCPYCTSTCDSNNADGASTTYRTLREFEAHLESNAHKSHVGVSELRTTLDGARRLLSEQLTHLVEHAFIDAMIKCQLCSRMIAWRRQTVSDHLREHSGYYPYTCSQCRTPFVDLPALFEHIHSERHAGARAQKSVVHGDHSLAVIRYCPDVKAETESNAIFSKCFPLLTSDFIESLEPELAAPRVPPIRVSTKHESGNQSPAASNFAVRSSSLFDSRTPPGESILQTNGANRSTLRCQLCQAQISRNMSCLIAHAKVHLAYKPLKCDHCNFRHFAMSKIRRHNARVHGSKPVKVSYHPVPDIGRQIKDMKWQCFGAYGGSGGHASVANATLANSNQMDDPALLEDEELRVFHEQEMANNTDQHQAGKRSFQVSDLLKEMAAVTKPGNGVQGNPLSMVPQNTSTVSSLSSLLAERLAAFENLAQTPLDRGVQQRFDTANIDQPIGNGLGKKMCSLCSALIANNPSSFENHACKHLDYKPYSCHYCPYQSYIRGKVTRHIQQVHNGEQVKISHKPVPGIRDRIQAVKLKCFPFLASLMSGDELANVSKFHAKLHKLEQRKDELPMTISCNLCATSVTNEPSSLETHLIETHMPQKIYCCASCTHRTPQLWKAKQHATGAHAPDLAKYVTCPVDEDETIEPSMALQILRLKCYGAASVRSSDPSSIPGTETVNFDESPLPVEKFKEEDDDEEIDETGPEFDQSNYLSNLIAAVNDQPVTAVSMQQNPVSITQVPTVVNPAPTTGASSGGGMLRKLICKLCNSTIADNPKSVGIHVKNHLNYKPYRCPYCRYMSCEQSKARRHIEHVHNASGDSIEVHAQENIKDRITEMKSRCFPNLGHMAITDVYGNGDDAATTGSCSPEYPPGTGGNGHGPVTISTVSPISVSQQMAVWNGCNLPTATTAVTSSIFPTLTQAPKTLPLFPRLHASQENFLLPNRYMGLQCHLCKTSNIRLDDMNAHAQTHLPSSLQQSFGKLSLNKPYQCSYCGVRFGSDEKACAHMANVHPTLAPKFVYQPECFADPEQLMAIKKQCFPELFLNYLNDLFSSNGRVGNSSGVDAMAAVAAVSGFLAAKSSGQSSVRNDVGSPTYGSPTSSLKVDPENTQKSDFNTSLTSPNKSSGLLQSTKISTPIDGRLTCQICDQAVSMNPNSLDVHVKNHLDFKPHSCAYCDYKSCIAGKVKRHLDNVHKGKYPKIDSFTRSSNLLKQVIADMRTACFPNMEGDYRSKTAFELSLTVEKLRKQLKCEIGLLRTSASDQRGGDQQGDDDGAEDLQIRTDDASVRNSNAGPDAFSPPISKWRISNLVSPNEENSLLDTSLDEDMLSNCGTDTLSESGIGSGNSGASTALLGNTGKLNCMLCGTMVADNPSSLGLHVRNHLDYKPFHCLLCDYKSCIQAKVKRHLRNVHKCPTDEMTYNPVANIRAQVTEMKIRCFPREADTALNGRTSSAAREQGDRSYESLSGTVRNSWMAEPGSILDPEEDDEESGNDMEIGGSRNDLEQLAAVFTGLADDDNGGSSTIAHIECQICGERIAGDELSKTKHLTKHVCDYEYRCQYCAYTSFVQAETMKHITVQHPNSPLRVVRSSTGGDKLTTAYDRLNEQCFPVDGSITRNRNQPSITTCALCDTSMIDDPDVRLAHTLEHKDDAYYHCSECSFTHTDDKRIKEHTLKEHETWNGAATKMVANEKTSDELYAICFPVNGVVSPITFVNGTSPVLDSDGLDVEEETEFDDDEDELEEDSQAVKRRDAELTGTKMTPDGPRYICKLCQSPVSMYTSSLYVHVKNHMNYKPYACTLCDYKSPVKSKVRRHIQNTHKSQSDMESDIRYSPKAGVEQEVMRWKTLCFPELANTATLANDKVQCRLCQSDVSNTILSKTIHAKNHLDAKPYYCPYCAYKSCLRGETRRHVVRQHPDRPVDIRYQTEDLAKQADIDFMIDSCFPSESTANGDVRVEEDANTIALTTTVSNYGGVKRKAQSSSNTTPPSKKEKKLESNDVKSPDTKPETDVIPQRSSVYNLRATRSSTSTSSSTQKGHTKKESDESVKLGPAHRDWYCCYCSFKAHSKYVVKQHCLNEHPGRPVDVSDMSRLMQM